MQEITSLFLLIPHPVLVSTSVESEDSAERRTALDTDLFFQVANLESILPAEFKSHLTDFSKAFQTFEKSYITYEKQSVFALFALLFPL